MYEIDFKMQGKTREIFKISIKRFRFTTLYFDIAVKIVNRWVTE